MKPLWTRSAVPSLVLLGLLAQGEVIERVVVKVNGDIITLSEFEARQLAAVQQARISPDQVEEFLRKNNAKILQEAEDELLLVQKAGELEIKIRPEYLKEVLDGIKKENHLDSDQALEDQLQKEGLTLDDLKRNITRQILKRQVVSREVESHVTVSEADVRAEYDKHMELYRKPATVTLLEILLGPDDGDLAREIVEKARNGEDFVALSKAHSLARSKDSGGSLGTIARGELNPELEKVAFAVPVGGVSDPIVSADGIRILKVEAASPEKVTTFESVKSDLSRKLMDERLQTEYQAYIEKLRKDAMMEVKVREVPTEVLGPQTPTVETGPATGASPAPPAAGAVSPQDDSEISTTGSQKPEKYTPGQAPKAEPAPSPSPSPEP
jgi:parvulin-like peptidyl-prolyl isomerase